LPIATATCRTASWSWPTRPGQPTAPGRPRVGRVHAGRTRGARNRASRPALRYHFVQGGPGRRLPVVLQRPRPRAKRGMWMRFAVTGDRQDPLHHHHLGCRAGPRLTSGARASLATSCCFFPEEPLLESRRRLDRKCRLSSRPAARCAGPGRPEQMHFSSVSSKPPYDGSALRPETDTLNRTVQSRFTPPERKSFKPAPLRASSNLLNYRAFNIRVPKWPWFGCVGERGPRETETGPKWPLGPGAVIRTIRQEWPHSAGLWPR
jgi:hypothetical protein